MEDGGASALEPFLILAKNTKGRACTALIQQVLNHKKLSSTEYAAHLELLKLFAYGTIADYRENKQNLPDLTDGQLRKLRQLTLVSLAQKSKRLEYSLLLQELDLSSVRELEDLIIESIYLGLVKGKMDQKARLLDVKVAIGRDVREEDIDAMILKFEHWHSVSAALLRTIGDQMRMVDESQAAEKERAKLVKSRVEELQKTIKFHQDDSARMEAELLEEDHEMMRRRPKRRMPTAVDRSRMVRL